jgi:hypothetical protein
MAKPQKTDEPLRVTSLGMFSVLTNPDGETLKRLAWAYGFSKKGSEVEARLREILIERARRDDPDARRG